MIGVADEMNIAIKRYKKLLNRVDSTQKFLSVM